MRRTKNKAFAWWDRAGSCWRTFQVSLFGGYERLPEGYPKSGAMRSGELFRSPYLVRRNAERVRELLPTPTVGMVTGGQNPETGGQMGLMYMARKNLWPTPKAMDGERTSIQVRARHDAKTGRTSLKGAVGRSMWPTPTSSERSGTNPKTGRGHGLSKVVKTWPTPTKSDGTGGPGTSGREGGPNLRTKVGGQLNPAWVEWLMGYPLGWTELR